MTRVSDPWVRGGSSLSRPDVARQQEEGAAALASVGVLLVVLVLALVAVVEAAVLLRVAGVAATAADQAALAAVTATQPGSAVSAHAAASRVARGNGAELTSCDCGPQQANVTVEVPVDRWLLGQIGIDRVRATGQARLVPP
jgi:Flp pilus assembly protein TadG